MNSPFFLLPGFVAFRPISRDWVFALSAAFDRADPISFACVFFHLVVLLQK
jgi:hypothetical protein